MVKKRVTQQDIAVKAGVDRSTVSLALRNSPRLPAATRKRIRSVAEKLGYFPDPMLTALAQYRHSFSQHTFHGTIAWLVNDSTTSGFQNNPHYRDYYTGALQCAQKRGFKLEVLTFDQRTTTSRRLEEILRARNIQGLLLSPQPAGFKPLKLNWNLFSVITFGYSLTSPAMHTIAAAHYRSTRKVLDILRQRGYRRIGLALSAMTDDRCDNPYAAAYAGYFLRNEQPIPCRPLLLDEIRPNIEKVHRWLWEERPDAALINHYNVIKLLREARLDIPEGTGITCASLPYADDEFSGIVENSIHIGEVAVDMLVAMMNRGERGLPEFPQRIHVEGKWFEGTSLRPPPQTVFEK